MYKILAISFIGLFSCTQSPSVAQEMKQEFKDYWYDNTGEISSYDLKISRYGMVREGKAMMIFVTEHHSPSLGAKPDSYKKDQVPVLKLNSTMNFITGVYPYSIMTSSFMPIDNAKHSLKLTTSVQEWCGHTYMEMRNDKKMDFKVYSYFDGENSSSTFEKTWMEDDLFSIIRINPDDLPMGSLSVIPSFYKLRMSHIDLQPYRCIATTKSEGNIKVYSLEYPELERTFSIKYENRFPYKIQGWEESSIGGFGANKKVITSKATLSNSIKSTYWALSAEEGAQKRKELGLETKY